MTSEEHDIDVSDFLFEELMSLDFLTEESACTHQTQTSTTGKRKFPSLNNRTDNRLCMRKSRKVIETTIKLPDEVRSTQFAKYILEEQFKFVPEKQIEPVEPKLYPFPHFSTYDALFCIPSTMASFLNSGDCDSIHELFNAFWHKSCVVNMSKSTKTDMSVPAYLDLLRLFLELHPDSSMCMHTTKDTGNEICADLYFKCTNSRVIFDSVARTSQQAAFVPPRAEWFEQALSATSKSPDEGSRFKELMDSDSDVELYGHVDLRICYNKHSKKIMHMGVFIDITSAHPIEINERSASISDAT